MANQAATLPLIEVDYYNCIWNKKILTPQPQSQTNNIVVPGGAGSAATNVYPLNNVYAPPFTAGTGTSTPGFPSTPYVKPIDGYAGSNVIENFYVEESRIEGGFNNTSMELGVRAYLDEDDPIQQHRSNTLIYSGIYNSRTGLNRTNEFPIGTSITRSANPQYNSIQKIYAEENNLVVLQEDKCSRCLIDKNAIYNAEGGGSVTTTDQVLGEIVPYTGEYGISRNPESFAIYAYRKYFVDRHRNCVIRLSNDGITEISEYGMRDYFRDQLTPLNDDYTNQYTKKLSTVNFVAPSSIVKPGEGGTQSFFDVVDPNPPAEPPYTSQIGSLSQYTLGAKVFYSSDGGGTYVDTTATVKNVEENRIQLDKILDPVFFEDGYDSRIKLVSNYRSRIPAGWDIYNKQYVLSIQPNKTTEDSINGPLRRDTTYFTLGFDEQINGWPSFYTYRPSNLGSLKNTYYTFNNYPWDGSQNLTLGNYKHYNDSVQRGQFYGINNASQVSIVANSRPSLQKTFLTIDYEGDSGWQVSTATSDTTGENKIYVAGVPPADPSWTGDWDRFSDTTSSTRPSVYSYVEGAYDTVGNEGTSAIPTRGLLRAGFDRKANRYVANFINTSGAQNGEVAYGNQISGVKGYYLDVTLKTDGQTDPGGFKELYAVGLSYTVNAN